MLLEYQELEMSEALENIQERLGLYAWLFIHDIKKENHKHSHEESIKILALACQKFKHSYLRELKVQYSIYEEFTTLHSWYREYLRHKMLETRIPKDLNFYASEISRIDTRSYVTKVNYPSTYDFGENNPPGKFEYNFPGLKGGTE